MNKKFFSIFAVVLSMTVFAKQSFTILVPEKAEIGEQKAANELKLHLQKIANIAITNTKNQTTGKTIIIRQDHSEKECESWNLQAYSDNEIILTGGSRGVLYAAYEFLERFAGVNWLDEYTTYGPEHCPVWKKGMSLHGKPSFRWRSVYTYHSGKPSGIDYSCRNRQNFFADRDPNKNLQLKSFALTPCFGSPRFCHTEYDYTKQWPKDTPPEYFSLTKQNKRVRAVSPMGPGTICMAHPGVRKKFIVQLKEFIRKDRINIPRYAYPQIYSIFLNDNYNPCVCPKCLALCRKFGNRTGLYIDFLNEIAREIRIEYPDVKILGAAYLYTQTPPPANTKLEPNITIQLAQIGCEYCGGDRVTRDSHRPFTHRNNLNAKAEFQKWSTFGLLSIWDYWITYNDTGLLTENSASVAYNLKFCNGKVILYFAECESPLETSFNPLRVWIGYRFMNNAALEPSEEINRFMKKYYGKCYPEMETIRQMIVKENKTVTLPLSCSLLQRKELNKLFFERAETLFDTALKKCDGDTELRLKILRERMQFDMARFQIYSLPADTKPGYKIVKKRLLADYQLLAPRYYVGSALKKKVTALCSLVNRTPISVASVKEFPHRKVVARYIGNAIKMHHGVKLQKDPLAETGVASVLKVSDPVNNGLLAGLYDTNRKKTQSRKILFSNDINDGKYHWYFAGTYTICQSCYLFIHKSWRMQKQLEELYGMAPSNKVDVYLRMRFVTESNGQKITALWLDQIAVFVP